MNKQYLGDSVYIQTEDRGFVLTTENGFGADNTIYLEPEVVVSLICYVTKAMMTQEGGDNVDRGEKTAVS